MKKFMINVIGDDSMNRIVHAINLDDAMKIAASQFSGKTYRVFQISF